MADRPVKRALISVYDKTGIVGFARALHEEFGIEIISTAGTARLLRDNDIPVTLVEDLTGWGETLDGRVKTLHPGIYAAILADRDNAAHMKQLADAGIKPIDMVVVNLYPFAKTVADADHKFAEAIEMIDIGGPCLLRAAAKNHRHVLISSSPLSYELAIHALRNWSDRERRMDALEAGAFVAFWDIARYDAKVAEWLSARYENQQDWFRTLHFFNRGPLRHGENPHQRSDLLTVEEFQSASAPDLTTADVEPEQQEPCSHNNYIDAHAALQLCEDLSTAQRLKEPRAEAHGSLGRFACVFVKHTNACGVGVADDPVEAYRRAYLGDPDAAMGGILACNFAVDRSFAEGVMDSFSRWGKKAGVGAFFVEVWLATSFDQDAVGYIRSARKWGQRVRLLDMGDMSAPPDPNAVEIRSIAGGVLRQTPDTIGLDEEQWKVVTKREPTEQEMNDLRLAWLVCKHTKSNAVSICRDGMLIGNGAGQMSRVMSCRIAAWLANDNGHGDKLPGAAAASDGFFPFRDGPDLLIDAGVSALIQPGGSKRDTETIAACDERDVAMIFTGTRHFRH